MSITPNYKSAFTIPKGDIITTDWLQLLRESDGSILGWIDQNGVPQGSLAVPAGGAALPLGSIQGNNAGTVTGIPGSVIDFVTGIITLTGLSLAGIGGPGTFADSGGNLGSPGQLLGSAGPGSGVVWTNPTGVATVPWVDIQNFGGLPITSASVQTGATATTVSGSPNVTVADNFFHLYQHLINGQGVCIWAAGAATAQSTPSAPTITSPVVQGSATLTYKIVGYDAMGGLTAASSAGTVTNAPAVFGPLPVVISSISQTSNVVTVNLAAPLNGTVAPGMTLHISNVTGAGTGFNGVWIIASAPTTSQVTYALAGNAGSGTVSASSMGRVSNSQPVTAVTRDATGLITITTAQAHGYQPNAGLNPTVIVLEGCTPVDLNGWYTIATASGSTVTCNTGVLSAESASVVGSCTVWEFTTVTCPVLSGTTKGYYIYSDSANPGGSLALIGRTIHGEHHFVDWGPTIAAGYAAPGYVPTTPPGSAQNQMFTSTVKSGGGTFNLVLNDNVPTSIPALGATILFDDGPNLVAAMGSGGGQVVISPPRIVLTTPGYLFNSPVTIPAGTTLTISAECIINETFFSSGKNQITASFSTGDLPSIAFGQRNYVNITGLANPMMCITGQTGSGNIDGLCFTCKSNGQTGVEIFNNSYNVISNCAFTATTNNFGNAVGLILNGACTLCKLIDCNFELANRFQGPGTLGQSSWGPPIPALWVRASDNASITSNGQLTSRFLMSGKNTGSGRGIMFDQQYATTVSISGAYYLGDSLWWQQGTTPIVSVWGQQFFSIELHFVINDTSEAPCFANWASFGSSNVVLDSCSTNQSFGVVTGTAINSLTTLQCTPNYKPTLQRIATATLTSSASTSDLVILPSYNANGAVTLIPTNPSAALDVAAGNAYISAKATGQVLVAHSATSGMTFDIMGAVNN